MGLGAWGALPQIVFTALQMWFASHVIYGVQVGKNFYHFFKLYFIMCVSLILPGVFNLLLQPSV